MRVRLKHIVDCLCLSSRYYRILCLCMQLTVLIFVHIHAMDQHIIRRQHLNENFYRRARERTEENKNFREMRRKMKFFFFNRTKQGILPVDDKIRN